MMRRKQSGIRYMIETIAWFVGIGMAAAITGLTFGALTLTMR